MNDDISKLNDQLKNMSLHQLVDTLERGLDQAPNKGNKDQQDGAKALVQSIKQKSEDLNLKVTEYEKEINNIKTEAEDSHKEHIIAMKRLKSDHESKIDKSQLEAYRSIAEKLILPLVDAISSCIERIGSDENPNIKELKDTLEISKAKLIYDLSSSYNIKEISPKIGDPFDPEVHHAVKTTSNTDMTSDQIITHLKQIGYQMYRNGDDKIDSFKRLLRPAMVELGPKPDNDSNNKNSQ